MDVRWSRCDVARYTRRISEAFAAQTLADGRALGFDWDKVNVNGGAIALAHRSVPAGPASSRRCSTNSTVARAATELATLCLGDRGSVAMAVERV